MRYVGLLILGIIVAFGLALGAPAEDDENARLKKEIMDELEKKLDKKLSDLKKDLIDAIRDTKKKPERKNRVVIEKKPGIKRIEPKDAGKTQKRGKHIEKRGKIEKRVVKKNDIDLKKELEDIIRLPEVICPNCKKKFNLGFDHLYPNVEDLEDAVRRLMERIVKGDAERGAPPLWRGTDPRKRPWPKAPGGEEWARKWKKWGEEFEGTEKDVEEFLKDLDEMLEELEKALREDEKEGSEKGPGKFRFKVLPGGERVPKKFWDNYKRKLDEKGEADEEYEEEFEVPGGGKGKIRVKVKGSKSGDGNRSEERTIEIEKKYKDDGDSESSEEKQTPERLKRQRIVEPERL